MTKENHEYLRALFITDPLTDMERILTSRDVLVEGSCSWIFGDMTYTKWLNSKVSQTLWIHGNPGKGKTMLTTALIAELSTRLEHSDSSKSVLAYFFCDNKTIDNNTAVAILRGLLYQILRQQPDLTHHFKAEYQTQGAQLFESKNALHTMWRIVQKTLLRSLLDRVYFVVDALDECDLESRTILLKLMEGNTNKDMARSALGPVVKWILTSRNEIDVKETMCDNLEISLEVNSSSVGRAVSSFIDLKMEQLQKKKRYPEPRRQLVRKILMEKAEGTFLWVSLACAELQKVQPTARNISRVLSNLPSGLEAIYAQILDRATVDAEKEVADITKEILKAVIIAIRPLNLYEMAITADIAKEDWNDLKEYVSQCGSLLTVRRGIRGRDIRGMLFSNTTVHLVHQSAKDFLTSPSSKLFLSPALAQENGILAKRCLSCICSVIFANRPTDLTSLEVDESSGSESDFQSSRGGGHAPVKVESHAQKDIHDVQPSVCLEYPILQWMNHGKIASADIGEIYDTYRGFFETSSYIRNSWMVSYKTNYHSRGYGILRNLEPSTFTPLHLGVYSGIYPLVERMLNRNAEMDPSRPESHLDTRDSRGRSALIWAASCGYKDISHLLLERGADPHLADYSADTALNVATRKGRRAVVQVLLDHGASVDSKDNQGYPPLVIASEYGYDTIAGLLLQYGADTDAMNEGGDTALTISACKGHGTIVQLLLDRGASINRKNRAEITPLISALTWGQEIVAMLLMQHEVDIEAVDGEGNTALILSILFGSVATVQALLDHGASVNVKGYWGITALSLASEKGHKAVMELLLQHGADIDAVDINGNTALIISSHGSHKAIVKMLLDHRAQTNVQNNIGRTALMEASIVDDQAEVVNLLLMYDADVDLKDERGYSALWYASNKDIKRL